MTQLTFWQEERPVKVSPWLDSETDLTMSGETLLLSSSASAMNSIPPSSSGRMSPASSATIPTLSDASLPGWLAQTPHSLSQKMQEGDGQTRVWLMGREEQSHGAFSMLNFSARPNAAVESSLSQVLIPNVPQKILFESKSLCGDIATGREAGESIAASTRSRPSSSDGRLYLTGDCADGGRGEDSSDGGGLGCLTPWLPQRQRIHAAIGVCPTLFANSNGGGHGVPTLAIESRELMNGIEGELGQVVAHSLKAKSALDHRADSDNLIAVSTDHNIECYKRRGGYGWSAAQNVSPTLESQGGSHQGTPDNIPLVPADSRTFDTVGAAIGREPQNGPQYGEVAEDSTFTLNCTETHAVCYDMTHADDVIREVKSGIVPTLQARMGTGGNQIPLVASCPHPADPLYFEERIGRNGCGQVNQLAACLRGDAGDGDSAACVVYDAPTIAPCLCQADSNGRGHFRGCCSYARQHRRRCCHGSGL